MAQEDFAKLGFEIDAKGAKAAFTAIMKRLDDLDAKTVEVSKHIGQQMAAAFDLKKLDTSAIDAFSNSVVDSSEKASKAISKVGKSAMSSLDMEEAKNDTKKFLSIIEDIKSKFAETQKRFLGNTKVTSELVENAKKAADAIAREYSDRIGNLKLTPNIDAYAKSVKVNLEKVSNGIELVKSKIGNSIAFPSIQKSKLDYNQAVDLDFPKVDSANTTKVDSLGKSISELNTIAGGNKLNLLASAIENIKNQYAALAEVASATPLTNLAESLKTINTFEFKNDEVKKMIQQFIDLRDVIAKQGDVKTTALFSVDALKKDFEGNLMPALEQMKKKASELLTNVQETGIKIPVTFDLANANAEEMVSNINKSIADLRTKIREGTTEVKFPSIPIRFTYVKALDDLRKSLGKLTVDQQPTIKINADISLPADSVKGAKDKNKQAQTLTLPAPVIAPISDIDMGKYLSDMQQKLSSMGALNVKADISPSFTVKPEVMTSINAMSAELKKLVSDIDAVNAKQIALKPVESNNADAQKIIREIAPLSLPAPSIKPVDEKTIKKVFSDAQAILNNSILLVSAPRFVEPTQNEFRDWLNHSQAAFDFLADLKIKAPTIQLISEDAIKNVTADAQNKINSQPMSFQSPVIAKVTQKEIDDAIASCQALLSKAILSIQAPVIVQPTQNDIEYLHKNVQLMLDALPRLTVKAPEIAKATPEVISSYTQSIQAALMDNAKLALPSPGINMVSGEKINLLMQDVKKKIGAQAKPRIETELRKVLNENISNVVADAKARIAKHKVYTASPTIPFAKNDSINAVIADLKDRFAKRNVEVPALSVSLAVDEILKKKAKIDEAFGNLPKELPMVKVSKEDLDSMKSYADSIKAVADSLRYLRGVQITLSTVMKSGAGNADNLVPLGMNLNELETKKAEITKSIGEMSEKVMAKMAEMDALDKKKPSEKGRIHALTQDIREFNNQIKMAEASVVEINNQIRKQAEKSTFFPEKVLADGQRNVEKIYSDTQSSVAEISRKRNELAANKDLESLQQARAIIDKTKDGVESTTLSFKKYQDRMADVEEKTKKFNVDAFEQASKQARRITDETWSEVKANSNKYLVMNPDSLVDPLKKMRGELKLTNNSYLDMIRSMGVYLSARSVVNYFRSATNSAMTFGYEIRKIQSLALNFDFGKLYSGLMDLDARFGNVTQNARALYWAYSSGIRGTEKDLVKFTEIMSKTATTINADVMPTVDAATAIMNAYGLSAARASEVADLMFTVVKEGKASAQELTSSFGNIIATAASLGVSLDDLGAAAATLTKTMRTNKAFTYLNNIMGKMVKPTKEISDYAATLGVEFSASAVKAKGFANVMRELHEATGGNINKIARLFPDLRGQRAALTLLSTQYKDFMQQVENFENKTGNMEEALGKIANSPESAFLALRNAMSMLTIEAGYAVQKFITLGGVLETPIKFINSMSSGWKKFSGGLVASTATMGAMVMAQKALAMASFASAQANTMINLSVLDEAKARLQSAVFTRQQHVEQAEFNLKRMEEKRINDELNDGILQTLNVQIKANNEELNGLKTLESKLKAQRDINKAMIDQATLGKMAIADEEKMKMITLQRQVAELKSSQTITDAKQAQALSQLAARKHSEMMANLKMKEAEAGLKYTAQEETYFEIAGRAKYMMGDLKDNKDTFEYQQAASLYDEFAPKAFGTKWERLSKEQLEPAKERVEAIAFQLKASSESVKNALAVKLTPEQLAAEELSNIVELRKQNINLQLQEIKLSANQIKDEQVRANLFKEVETSTALLEQQSTVQDLERKKLLRESELGLTETSAQIKIEQAAVNTLKADLKRAQSDMEVTSTNAELMVKNATVKGGRAGRKETQEQLKMMDEMTAKIQNRNKELGAVPDKLPKIESEAVKHLREQIAERNKLISLNQKMLGNDEKTATIQAEINRLVNERSVLQTKVLNRTGMGVMEAGKQAYSQGANSGAMMGTMMLLRGAGFLSGPAGMFASMLPINKMLAGSIGTLNASLTTLFSRTKIISKQMIESGVSAAGLSTALGGQSLATLFSANAAQTLKISEIQLALMRKTTIATGMAAAGVITAVATGLYFLLKNRDGALPLQGLADSLIGLDKLKDKGTALDDYMQAVKERSARNLEIEQSMESYLASTSKEIELLQERINGLKNVEGKQEELNRAISSLNAATFGNEMMGDLQRKLQEAISNAPNMADDQAIKAAKARLAQKQNELGKLGEEIGWSEGGSIADAMFSAFTQPFDTYKYVKLRDGEFSQANNELVELEASFKRNQEIAIGALQAPIQSLRSLANIQESITDAYMNDKTAKEQLDIARRRLEMMEANRRALFGVDTDVTNIYSAYLAEAKKQNDKINLVQAELQSLIEKRGKLNLNDNDKKALDTKIEEAEKNLDDAQQKNQKFQEDFGKATTSMIDQQMKVMDSLFKQVEEANKKLSLEAKRRDFEAGSFSDGIELTRAIETYKNYVSGMDAPKAELAKTEKEIKETFKKQFELQELLGKGKAGDITKTKEDITGFQTKLEELENLRQMQQNKLNENDEKMLDARIAVANQFGKMIDKLKQNQDKLNQNLSGLDNELWDRILSAPNQMFATLKKNNFSMDIGNSVAEMIRNRVNALETDKNADVIGVNKNIELLRAMSPEQKKTNDGIAQYASLLQDAQSALDNANESWKMEIAIKRKLADAEKKANDEAVKLANQLNEGFKTNIQKGFTANSMEAMELQNRSWDKTLLPKLETKKQDEADKSWLKMIEYNKGISEELAAGIKESATALKTVADSINVENSKALATASKNLDDAATKFSRVADKLKGVTIVDAF